MSLESQPLTYNDLAILNRDKLTEMSEEIGTDNIPVILNIFLGELSQYQQTLTDTTLTPQELNDYVAQISHALKSSAASFGADALCQFALRLDGKVKRNEPLCRQSDVEPMQTLLAMTHQHYAQLTARYQE